MGQDNFLFYRPHFKVTLRIEPHDNLLDILRIAATALICGTPLEVSTGKKLGLPVEIGLTVIEESEEEFCSKISKGSITRVRLLSQPSEKLNAALGNEGINVHPGPVMANGRLELLHMLREVSLSKDYHRYGYLGERENEERSPLKPSKQEEEAHGARCCCLQS